MVILGSFTHTYSQSYGKNKYRDKNYLDGRVSICQLMCIAITVIAKQKGRSHDTQVRNRPFCNCHRRIVCRTAGKRCRHHFPEPVRKKRRACPWRFC
ncbi:hypothetical protein AGR1B_Lc50115 [Agrobacterium fabacearum S56]|nr:hypothetical protein AGR1B_Lc50115 [Agrobacterium fabacearum S56]